MFKRHNPKIIQLEFNELSPALLERFMNAGFLPNFKRLHAASHVFHSDAEVPVEYLEPWIQWPTVHSGLEYQEHGIFHLGEGRKISRKAVGDYLSEAGYRVGIFGSMNCGYGQVNGYVVPDPWDETARAHPEFLSPFVDFVSKQVQESSRAAGFKLNELLNFGWFLARHGVRPQSVLAGVEQLAQEIRKPTLKWRRAIVMETLCYDLFRYLNEKFKVDYATFFCNSTAHFQHYYWRHFEPDHFEVKSTDAEQSEYAKTVLSGYVAMDRILSRVLSDYPKSTILFCTALSQKAWPETKKCLFRISDPAAFFAFADVSDVPVSIRPVMAQQFYFDFATEQAAQRAYTQLGALQWEGSPVCWFEKQGNSLFGGCSVEDSKALHGTVYSSLSSKRAKFSELFYQIHGMRSGRHDSKGALWIRKTKHELHANDVKLTQIAPTILSEFQLTPPGSMRGEALRLS